MRPWFARWRRIPAVGLAGLAAAALAVGAVAYLRSTEAKTKTPAPPVAPPASPRPVPAEAPGGAESTASVVVMDPGQQGTIGLAVEPARAEEATVLIRAPGQIVPDETKYAYITPRAAGVLRSVAAFEGQEVAAGDLLATIDSPDVAQARFDLVIQLQELEIAQSQAEWEASIYKNTTALLERLKAGVSPDDIQKEFADRPVGTNRERLIRAYAAERLARVTFERNRDLLRQKIIATKQFQEAEAAYEGAEAAYQGLIEQMQYNARLAHTRAQQALHKVETAVRVARERLRVLGVRPDGTEPVVRGGKVIGVLPDGTMPVASGEGVPPEGPETAPGASPAEAILPGDDRAGAPPVTPVGAEPGKEAGRPVSTYSIWAPFHGTIIDRMMIVPGVPVDMTSRLFTLTDLTHVWVEVHLHESDYGQVALDKRFRPEVRFTSPAYPDATFEAEVIYSGDVVDPKTRTLKLMARADNPGRRLKPGMFVDVEIRIPSDRKAVEIPASALLTEDDGSLVFVQTAPDRFERRDIVPGSAHGDRVEVLSGLRAGEKVVARGAFKLKAEALLAGDDAGGRGDAEGEGARR